ncbi:hypothetical protein K3495_g3887 [Podosphaera aphanis]|nr:hypothetical protein K3495_g3887 [Podosphaera aphanis]
MTGPSDVQDVEMSNNNHNPNLGISQIDMQELLRLLEDRRSQPSQLPAAAAVADQIHQRTFKREAQLMKWDGELQEFPFFIHLLEARIEDLVRSYSDRSICMDMVNTLPADKRARIAGWFEDKRQPKDYNWREIFQRFREESETNRRRFLQQRSF